MLESPPIGVLSVRMEMLSRITGASMVRDSTRVEATDVGAYASVVRNPTPPSSTRIDGSEGGAVTIIIGALHLL